MTLFIIIAWIVTIIIAFLAGFLVYRNNAKKFKKLEEEAKTNPTIKAILEKLE
jgi:septation ring formation regulator EzrA